MRLDHLLSKEHTPRWSASVWPRMVVFASGIVDEGLPRWVVGLSTTSSLLGVWNLVGLLGGVVLAHCWVLRDHAWSSDLIFSRPPLPGSCRLVGCGCWWVWCLVVEQWTRASSSACGVLLVGHVGECLGSKYVEQLRWTHALACVLSGLLCCVSASSILAVSRLSPVGGDRSCCFC